MVYQKELEFLINVFNKCHVDAVILNENSLEEKENEYNNFLSTRNYIKNNLALLKSENLYKLTDDFGLCYRFLLLPGQPVKSALFIGPFLSIKMPEQRILEISESNDFPPKQYNFLLEFYSSLPVLAENSQLLTMLTAFCEILWGTPSFLTTDFLNENLFSGAPFSKTLLNADPASSLIKKEAIERRYAFENELIRAVASGQTQFESNFISPLSNEVFEKRTPDPLQNAKNYCIIMNTLLRKGAEQGGVHPVYLNQISSEFALKIENISSAVVVQDLMREMFRSYCRLVRKHNIRPYTPIVQKTVLLIDSDLSNDLSSKTIANHLGVSLGYLCSVFKKETGKTISQYVCHRRMDYAQHLLSTTNLQIQTIALHCGIMDVQYFSKQFKRVKGKTPSNFRRQKK